MQVTPYLYFRGACEDALKFYEASGLGSIKLLQRYEGTPMAERDGGAWRDKVLHSLFEGPGVRLFASDGPDSEPMKGSALLIEIDDPDAAGSLFAALSEGGRVTCRSSYSSGGSLRQFHGQVRRSVGREQQPEISNATPTGLRCRCDEFARHTRGARQADRNLQSLAPRFHGRERSFGARSQPWQWQPAWSHPSRLLWWSAQTSLQ